MGGSSSKPAPEEQFSAFATADVEREIKEKGLSGLKAIFEKKRNEWKDVPLNVAILATREQGNPRSLTHFGPWMLTMKVARQSVEVETTKVVKAYEHPNNKNLKVWELTRCGH